jgi:mannitol-specific phosphotransferase system IIBC component
MFDFVDSLGLCCENLNPNKEIITFVIVCKKLTYVFGAKQQNKWKTSVNEFLTKEDYETLCKLYENVYAHLP